MLNPALDLPELAARFARTGRLQIEGVLVPEAAETLHECLARAVPWNMAYLDGQGRPTTLSPEQRMSLGPAGCAQIRADVARQARQGYQFLYHAYHMVSAYKAGRDTHLPLRQTLEFLNSPGFLGPLRTITGAEDVVRADAQATCYVAGDFLRWHTDHDEHMGRRVAYVLGLTRDWQADWGGLLQFLGPDGSVIETLMPRFNTLSIFRVPTPHCVSMVAPWATTPRLSITGWLMRAEAQ